MKEKKMEIPSLTEQQRIFADENHSLVLKFMHKHNLPIQENNDVSDWYGICCTGFCKAVSTYQKEENVKFSSYAYACMENELKMHFRHENSQKIIKDKLKTSFEKGILSDDNEITGFENLLSEEKSMNFEDDCIFQIQFQKCMDTLKRLDKQIIYLLLDGHSVREVSEITKTDVNYVMRVKYQFRKIWTKQ